MHQYLWKLFGSQKEFSNVSLHEELCVPLCGWRILSTNSDTLGRLYLLRLMFVALFGSWKEIVMDNWGRSLLQRVRNCINIVDSGQDTAEKYSWLQRTQKACFGFHSALREAMQNPTCRNGDLQSSCIIFEKSGFWGRVKILGVGGLMSIKREVCTMVWLFWLSYPGDRASGLLLSRPVTSVKHSDNFFLTNSLCPLCSNPPTVDIIVVTMIIFASVIVIIIILTNSCSDPNSWHCHDPGRHQHLCRHKVGRC